MPVVQIDDRCTGDGKVGQIYKDLHTRFLAFYQ